MSVLWSAKIVMGHSECCLVENNKTSQLKYNNLNSALFLNLGCLQFD